MNLSDLCNAIKKILWIEFQVIKTIKNRDVLVLKIIFDSKGGGGGGGAYK